MHLQSRWVLSVQTTHELTLGGGGISHSANFQLRKDADHSPVEKKYFGDLARQPRVELRTSETKTLAFLFAFYDFLDETTLVGNTSDALPVYESSHFRLTRVLK